MYLRILCKIHVSDSCLSIFISQGPLQDPCLRIHVSASSSLRILCKIHVSNSCLSIHVSASIYISGSSARSMSLESQHLRVSGFSTRCRNALWLKPLAQGVSVQAVLQLIIALRVSRCLFLSFDCVSFGVLCSARVSSGAFCVG